METLKGRGRSQYIHGISRGRIVKIVVSCLRENGVKDKPPILPEIGHTGASPENVINNIKFLRDFHMQLFLYIGSGSDNKFASLSYFKK